MSSKKKDGFQENKKRCELVAKKLISLLQKEFPDSYVFQAITLGIAMKEVNGMKIKPEATEIVEKGESVL